uniref:C2H2-type domain-containing protein n=1 Tax=Leptobrachium leishanense TaxID=445787 RepID=A0A8C5M852_9ANUR
MIMNEKNPLTQRILDLTLEIINLLTGEHHIVVKIPCGRDDGDGSCHQVSEGYCRSHSTNTGPSALSLTIEKNNDQKILELTNKIMRLLTGEVSIKYEDITFNFSMEEWEFVEGHKDLYKDAMMGIDQPVISLDKPVSAEFHTPVPTPDFVAQTITNDGGNYLQNVEMTSQAISTPCTTQQPLAFEERPVTDIDFYRPLEPEHMEYSPIELLKEMALQEMATFTDPRVPAPILIESNNPDNLVILDTKPVLNLSESSKNIFMNSELIRRNSVHKESYVSSSETEKHLSFGSDLMEKNGGSEELYSSPDFGENVSYRPILFDFQSIKTEPLFFCPECGKQFTDGFALKIHRGTHVKQHTFKCSECGKGFATLKEHVKHKRLHLRTKQFKCLDCGRCFTQAAYLASHRQIHSEERPFKCAECNRCFTQAAHLASHRQIHSGERPFKCLECGEHFAWSSQLDSHKRAHTGERSFKCPQCDKCFPSTTQLRKHMHIHMAEKPFKCGDCGKCFAQVQNLELHKLIHAGVKPYKCSECGRGFTRASYLSAHIKIHTGQKPYKCHCCGRCFNRKSSFTRHQKVHGK